MAMKLVVGLLLIAGMCQSYSLFSIMPEVSDTLLTEAITKLPTHARFELMDDNSSVTYDGYCKDCEITLKDSTLVSCKPKKCSDKPRVKDIDDFLLDVLVNSADSKLIDRLKVNSSKVLRFSTKWIKIFRSL